MIDSIIDSSNNSTQEFALIRLGEVQVAFPRTQVASVNLVADIESLDSDYENIGRISTKQQHWAIYSLSASFELESSMPKGARFCVCFNLQSNQQRYGLVCDEVGNIRTADTQLHSIPACMDNSLSPTHHLLLHNQQLVYVSNALQMYNYLDYCGINNSGVNYSGATPEVNNGTNNG